MCLSVHPRGIRRFKMSCYIDRAYGKRFFHVICDGETEITHVSEVVIKLLHLAADFVCSAIWVILFYLLATVACTEDPSCTSLAPELKQYTHIASWI